MENQDRVGSPAIQVPRKVAKGVVMQAEFRQGFAGFEMKIMEGEIRFIWGWHLRACGLLRECYRREKA